MRPRAKTTRGRRGAVSAGDGYDEGVIFGCSGGRAGRDEHVGVGVGTSTGSTVRAPTLRGIARTAAGIRYVGRIRRRIPITTEPS
jgi:hypothetical protein